MAMIREACVIEILLHNCGKIAYMIDIVPIVKGKKRDGGWLPALPIKMCEREEQRRSANKDVELS